MIETRLMNRILGLTVVAVLSACGGGNRANITIGSMPAGGTFTGVWRSPQYGEMHLCQNGGDVVGTYEKDERKGTVQGTVQGDVIRFQWEERRELVHGRPTITRGQGYFRYELGQDEDHFFRGQWGHNNNEIGGGPWNGVKMRRQKPTKCSGTPEAEEEGQEDYESDDYAEDDYSEEGTTSDDDVLGGLDTL